MRFIVRRRVLQYTHETGTLSNLATSSTVRSCPFGADCPGGRDLSNWTALVIAYAALPRCRAGRLLPLGCRFNSTYNLFRVRKAWRKSSAGFLPDIPRTKQ
jgi:hypothetical protein